MFRHLLGDDTVAVVTCVDEEHLSDALGDRTPFDAFVTYRRPDAPLSCIRDRDEAHEPFSQQAYNWGYYRDARCVRRRGLDHVR